MNLLPDDPRLSAWVLGELPPDEAVAIGRAVANDPALLAQTEELRGMSEFLTTSLAASALRPDQREAVRRAGRAPAANVVEFPAPRKASRRVWPLVLGAAAAIVFGAYLNFRPQGGERAVPVTGDAGSETILQPYPGPRITTVPPADRTKPARDPGPVLDHMARDLAQAHALPEPSQLPATIPLPAMRSDAEIDLPVLVGRASYDWVRGWIREKGQLPPKDAVRIEELANAFPLPAAEETREFAGLKIACLSMASPWSGAGRLVGVQIANESGQSRQVQWSFSPAAGARQGGVRVLASTGGSGDRAATLPAGRRTLVLIELASASDDAGDLVVSSSGRSKRFPANESKDPALQQAGLVAAFGIWLRGEGIDDSRLTQILATAEKDNNPAWTDSRKLVREALDIAAKK
ncbi:von Willebrand factor type A domain-containing protein [Luteolibacter sp. Populi]|uniref:VWA domain-containing protein n=1 Tax=Luteolibacter sp. Populi TaxID=3230487 RepID=UPI003466613D